VSKDRLRFADTDSGLADATKIKLLSIPETCRKVRKKNPSRFNTVFSQVSHLSNLCEENLSNVIFLMDAVCCLLWLKIACKKY